MSNVNSFSLHVVHKCSNKKIKKSVPGSFYGLPITTIEQVDGIWIGHNNEYGSSINFCPWCGVKLENV